jgi:transposase-like protein
VPKPVRNSQSSSPQSEPETPASGDSAESLETVAKRRRRVFTVADKLRIVKEADSCLASGKRGALGELLRREGIYSSLLSTWRAELGTHGTAGLAAKKAGRKLKLTEAERRVVELTKRNAVLERKLHVANALIALQKKAHDLLGIALPQSDEES